MKALKNIEDQKVRLRLTRLALMNGIDNQREWSRRIGVDYQVWFNAEKAKNGVPMTLAKAVRDRYKLPLLWMLEADMSGLTDDFIHKLERYSDPVNVQAKRAF